MQLEEPGLGSLLGSFGYQVKAVKQEPVNLAQLPALLAQRKVSAVYLPEPFGTVAE